MRARFGSSGIRGPVDSLITPELALAVGRAVGRHYDRVLIGRDPRVTSPALGAVVYGGLLCEGAKVWKSGMMSTPALAYSARHYDAGLLLTASHNPAEDNGFKLVNPDGRAFGPDQRGVIEDEVDALMDAPSTGIQWDEARAGRDDPQVFQRHKEAILDHVGDLARPLKVVVDAGNGAGSLETPGILADLGCEVVTLNGQPDGRFPGRPSEPRADHLTDLMNAVQSTEADLGIAHDGDADRCVAVTPAGEVVSGDHLNALLALEAIEQAGGPNGAKVAVPVDTSLAFHDVLADRAPGAEIITTPVGDAHVSDALERTDGVYGGETSGNFIFRDVSLCPDGPLAAVALVAAVARSDEDLGTMVEALPSYPLRRVNVPLPTEAVKDVNQRWAATQRVLAAVEDLGLGRTSELDGLRVSLDEGDGWVLVRASGTEPKLRVTVEARSQTRLEDVLEAVMGAVEGALEA